MDPLCNPLTTRPIQTGWEFTMEPYPSGQFGLIDDPDRQFGNGSVWTRTRTRSDGPEPLLTLGTHHYPCHDWRCYATCKWQPEAADRKPVLGLSPTGRQIRCASRANAGVWSFTSRTMVSQTKSWHKLVSIDSVESPRASGAEEMTPMTIEVASKLSEADNDNVTTSVWSGPGIQTLGATALDDLLTSIDVVLAFTRQTGECIELLGTTLEDITLDSPGESTDPSAGRNNQRAAAVVAAEEPIRGATWMTWIGSPWPEWSERTAGLGSCVGELIKDMASWIFPSTTSIFCLDSIG